VPNVIVFPTVKTGHAHFFTLDHDQADNNPNVIQPVFLTLFTPSPTIASDGIATIRSMPFFVLQENPVKIAELLHFVQEGEPIKADFSCLEVVSYPLECKDELERFAFKRFRLNKDIFSGTYRKNNIPVYRVSEVYTMLYGPDLPYRNHLASILLVVLRACTKRVMSLDEFLDVHAGEDSITYGLKQFFSYL